jgi:hypothetical protein
MRHILISHVHEANNVQSTQVLVRSELYNAVQQVFYRVNASVLLRIHSLHCVIVAC